MGEYKANYDYDAVIEPEIGITHWLRYLLDEIYVLYHSILELSATSWEDEIIARHFDPILIPFILSELWMRYIVIPYLQERNACFLVRSIS